MEKITAKYPDDKEAHYWLGDYISRRTAGDLRDLKRGIREEERVLELDPGNADAYQVLARIYEDLGEFEKALECAKKNNAVRPGNFNAFAVTASVYYRWGKLDKAVESYRKGLKLDPNVAGMAWGASYIEALRENYAAAISGIDQFLGLSPPPAVRLTTLNYRTFLKLWLGRFDEASRDIEEAAKIAEGQGNKSFAISADYWRFVVSWERRDFVLSRQLWDRSLKAKLELWPDAAREYSIDADYYYGLLDLKQGDTDSARKRFSGIESFTANIADPDSKSEWILICDILATEIGLREGRADMDRIIRISAEEPAFLANYPFAIYIGRIIENLHFLPYERDFIPRAHLLTGDLDKAIAAYERLVTFNPKSIDRRLIHPRNYYNLGKVCEQKGDKRKAKANYRKFLKLWKDADPGLPEVEDARRSLAGLKG